MSTRRDKLATPTFENCHRSDEALCDGLSALPVDLGGWAPTSTGRRDLLVEPGRKLIQEAKEPRPYLNIIEYNRLEIFYQDVDFKSKN